MRLRVNEKISELIDLVSQNDVKTGRRPSPAGLTEACDTEQKTILWDELKTLYGKSDYQSRGITLRSICQGSSIHLAAMSKNHEGRAPGKSPELIKHLADLQRRLDQKLYNDMVNDITIRERHAREHEHVSFRTYKDQLRYGVHVISMMVVFFIFGYTASYRVFHSDGYRLLCGIVLMFCGMIMETLLLVLKENKADFSTQIEKKNGMNIPTEVRGKPHQS